MPPNREFSRGQKKRKPRTDNPTRPAVKELYKLG